jgi:hypothetical protein
MHLNDKSVPKFFSTKGTKLVLNFYEVVLRKQKRSEPGPRHCRARRGGAGPPGPRRRGQASLNVNLPITIAVPALQLITIACISVAPEQIATDLLPP